MVERRVREAMEAMGGRLIAGDAERIFRGAALDSRAVEGGELFFALEGSRTDGHRFVADALERGAAAAVVSRPVEAPQGATLVEVDDTFRALHDLTRAVRREVPHHLVAITGSVGKTSTKELLGTMLERRFKVARSPGNLNNLYGFPLALLGIPDDTEWMVAEMGMSTPGELGGVSRLGRPDVAVFTNVRPAHLEAFEGGEARADVESIARAKSELLEGLAPDGTVVANAADPWVVRIARAARDRGRRVVWYALAEELPQEWEEPLLVVAEAIEAEPGASHFDLVAEGDRERVDLPLHGRVNVENFLAAAACARLLGLPLSEIAAAAAHVSPLGGRGVLLPLPCGGWLVDDSYNSNPDALAQALEAARALPGMRHWAVLGSMLELGSAAVRYHHEAGVKAALLGFDPVLAVGGDEARALADAAAKQGVEAVWLPGAEEAARMAVSTVRSGDVVLVKGSRGIGLERVVARLREEGGS